MTALPEGWVRTRLDEIAEVRLGRQRSPKNHSGHRMRPYIRAANITWSGLDLGDVKEMNFSEGESVIYELRPGDVLVSEASGSASEVGKPVIWKGEIDGCCFQNTVVRVRSHGEAMPEYLRYFLLNEASSGRLGEASPGVGIHHIGSARLSAWTVPLPPRDEQRRIVALIDEQLSHLDAAEISLTNAVKRLAVIAPLAIASEIRRNWPVVKLGDIGDERRNALAIGPFGSNLKVSDYRSQGVPLIFVRNVRSGKFGLSGQRFVSESKANELTAHTVRGGDVLVTKMGDPPGDSAVYPLGLPDAILTADCIKISVSDAFDPRFVALVIGSPAVKKQIVAATKGVAQKKVSLGRFKEVQIPAPPIADQRQFVERLERVASIVEPVAEAAAAARLSGSRLRRSMLELAFSGGLTLRARKPHVQGSEGILGVSIQ